MVLIFCKFSDYMVLIFAKKILHCILCIRWPVRYPDRSCSQPTCSKFHGESCDYLSFFHIFAIIICKHHLWWHIWLAVWLIYLNVSCAATRWHWVELLHWDVNKSSQNDFFLCRNRFYIKIFRLLQKRVAPIWKK